MKFTTEKLLLCTYLYGFLILEIRRLYECFERHFAANHATFECFERHFAANLATFWVFWATLCSKSRHFLSVLSDTLQQISPLFECFEWHFAANHATFECFEWQFAASHVRSVYIYIYIYIGHIISAHLSHPAINFLMLAKIKGI